MREGAKANTVQCAIGASWCAVQYWPCSRPSSMYDSSEHRESVVLRDHPLNVFATKTAKDKYTHVVQLAALAGGHLVSLAGGGHCCKRGRGGVASPANPQPPAFLGAMRLLKVSKEQPFAVARRS